MEPIAIVGRGAVLPGALNVGAFWREISAGSDLTMAVPDGIWPVSSRVANSVHDDADRKRLPKAFRGGFVTGFDEQFVADGFCLPADEIAGLDRSWRWLLDAGRQAIRDVGRDDLRSEASAVVLANLAYPTRAMTELAYRASVGRALGAEAPERRDWRDAYVAGRPAHLLADALGILGPAFALDAACASSIYAVKFACDYLLEGRADIAMAAALNGCDNIFLHRGFAEIQALSPSGRSRPFSRAADGLLPAEGAAAVLLKRLADAQRDDDRIFGVIRGIGLSNDGRSRGLVIPDVDGEVRAIRRALEACSVSPDTVSLLECHATGTPIGDRIEIEGLKRVFGDVADLPVASLKSNMGHLVTVAGLAAILKVSCAMEAGLRPATLGVGEPIEAFEGSRIRPLLEAEPWPDDLPRRAGVSNFGFGGNNAHLILDQDPPTAGLYSLAGGGTERPVPRPEATGTEEIAICGIGLVHGETRGMTAFAETCLAARGDGPGGRTSEVVLPLTGLRFPPNDLRNCLGQQTLALEAALQVAADVAFPARERTGTIIGMATDMNAARPGLRWRARSELLRASGEAGSEKIIEGIGGLTGPAHVMGAMPNLPANRINQVLDLAGLGFTVASEELSGITALELGAGMLRRHELDLVLAGAVDLSTDPFQRAASTALYGPDAPAAADGAIVVALKRRCDAERDGDEIFALVDVDPMHSAGEGLVVGQGQDAVAVGLPRAASGLFRLALQLVDREAPVHA